MRAVRAFLVEMYDIFLFITVVGLVWAFIEPKVLALLICLVFAIGKLAVVISEEREALHEQG